MKSPTSKKPKTNIDWNTIVIPDHDPKPCNHFFEFIEHGECKCKRCGLGLIGVIDIQDGKPI